MNNKTKELIYSVLLGILFVLILWITIVSRIGNSYRAFCPPLYSYKAILNGDLHVLLENISNIILFIPVGVTCVWILGEYHLHVSLFVGLIISFIIESSQWLFWIGTFEFDDLLNNGLGVFIGTFIANRLFNFEGNNIKRRIIILLVSVLLFLLPCYLYVNSKNETMQLYARMNNKNKDTQNLLVLDRDARYLGETNFNITYLPDGSVMVEGDSNDKAWIQIGMVTLEKGHYSFSGFSGVTPETIAISLERYNNTEKKFHRLTKDVGPIYEEKFYLDERATLRALINIYPGVKGCYIMRPVIYREVE